VPNTASAKKRVRQTAARNARNLWRKRRVKEQVKGVLTALQAQDVKKAEDEFRKACSVLDKIAATGTIHKNTAARRKSRLSSRILALKQSGKAR